MNGITLYVLPAHCTGPSSVFPSVELSLSGLSLGACPNPFSSGTRLVFESPAKSATSLDVFDVSGRAVFKRELGSIDAGPGSIDFDGRDDSGRPLPPGVWFARLRMSSGVEQTVRLVRTQ
jgi:hypothetical protein